MHILTTSWVQKICAICVCPMHCQDKVTFSSLFESFLRLGLNWKSPFYFFTPKQLLFFLGSACQFWFLGWDDIHSWPSCWVSSLICLNSSVTWISNIAQSLLISVYHRGGSFLGFHRFKLFSEMILIAKCVGIVSKMLLSPNSKMNQVILLQISIWKFFHFNLGYGC